MKAAPRPVGLGELGWVGAAGQEAMLPSRSVPGVSSAGHDSSGVELAFRWKPLSPGRACLPLLL